MADDRGKILDPVLAGFLFVTYVVLIMDFGPCCHFKTIGILKSLILILQDLFLISDQSRKFADPTTNLNN